MPAQVPTAAEVEELRQQVVELRQGLQAQAQAEALVLAAVYRLEGKPDPAAPFGGLLTTRLQLSISVLRQHLTEGRLGYFLGAKKAYRVPEPEVRRFIASQLRAAA